MNNKNKVDKDINLDEIYPIRLPSNTLETNLSSVNTTLNNNTLGGCESTRFGCCSDGTTAARSLSDSCKIRPLPQIMPINRTTVSILTDNNIYTGNCVSIGDELICNLRKE